MTHANPHSKHPDDKGDQQRPYWKRAHHDWKFWLAVSLMLTSMLVYIVTLDLSLRPTEHDQPKIESPLP
jgi:hypothetical protein